MDSLKEVNKQLKGRTNLEGPLINTCGGPDAKCAMSDLDCSSFDVVGDQSRVKKSNKQTNKNKQNKNIGHGILSSH